MNKSLIILLFLLFSFFGYAQDYRHTIDLLVKSFSRYYQFNHPTEIDKNTETEAICPPVPDDFYAYYRTDFIDFRSLREGFVSQFTFSDRLRSPLKQNLIVTSGYGMRNDNKHYGVDFRVNVGDTICSIFCGKVRIAKYDDTYGYVVVVRHYNMSETVYAHLNTILVRVDQEIVAGETVGLGGNTGVSSGPHLHFEIRYKGYPINPIVDNKLLKHLPVVYH